MNSSFFLCSFVRNKLKRLKGKKNLSLKAMYTKGKVSSIAPELKVGGKTGEGIIQTSSQAIFLLTASVLWTSDLLGLGMIFKWVRNCKCKLNGASQPPLEKVVE